jgi:hypothetical protein
MRTTVDLDDDVLVAARAIARGKRISLGKALSDLARRGLAPTPPSEVGPDALPVFDVPPDAPPITEDMVAAAIDEG